MGCSYAWHTHWLEKLSNFPGPSYSSVCLFAIIFIRHHAMRNSVQTALTVARSCSRQRRPNGLLQGRCLQINATPASSNPSLNLNIADPSDTSAAAPPGKVTYVLQCPLQLTFDFRCTIRSPRKSILPPLRLDQRLTESVYAERNACWLQRQGRKCMEE